MDALINSPRVARQPMPPRLFAFLLLSLVFFGWILASSTVTAHHAPGHHGSDLAECDCPPGIELTANAWVRWLPPTQSNTGAYLSLRNLTDSDLSIVAAESPVARVTELHDHQMDAAGIMRMRQVDQMVIPARGEMELKPGGLHVMLIDLIEPLQEGSRVPITLFIEGFQDLHIEALVQRSEVAEDHHHGHSH